MSGRLVQIAACQALYDDSCLRPLLDTDVETIHGSPAFCDEPLSVHGNPPVRREQMGWPADFQRACVTVGRVSRGPFNRRVRPWLENWTFVVSIFCRETIKLDNGDRAGTGDLWAQDIYAHVVRILGWSENPIDCDSGIAVFSRTHFGDVLPCNYDDKHRFWWIQTRFSWLVLSRGLVAPICVPCGTV